MLPLFSGKSRIVDGENHRDCRLIDHYSGKRLWIGSRGNRVADVDALDTCERDDVAGGRHFYRNLFQSFKSVELSDSGLLDSPPVLADRNLISLGYRPVEDPADGQPAEIVTVIQIGDENLQLGMGSTFRRGDGLDDLLE